MSDILYSLKASTSKKIKEELCENEDKEFVENRVGENSSARIGDDKTLLNI